MSWVTYGGSDDGEVIVMDDAARALLGLWDTTDDTMAGLDDAGWARPLAPAATRSGTASAVLDVGGADLTDLATHLTGVHHSSPERLREAVAVAHGRAERSVGRSTTTPPAAQCLDMCLHTHDLLAALERELDLDAAAPAALEGCRLVMGLLPRLMAAAPGRGASGMRVVVRARHGGPPVMDRTLRLADDRVVPADVGTADVIDADAAALLLVLAGRRRAGELAERDLLSWTGATATSVLGAA